MDTSRIANDLHFQVLVAQCAKPLFSKHAIFRNGLIDLTLDFVANAATTDKQQRRPAVQLQAAHSKSPSKGMATENARAAEQSEEADDSTPLLQQNKAHTLC